MSRLVMGSTRREVLVMNADCQSLVVGVVGVAGQWQGRQDEQQGLAN